MMIEFEQLSDLELMRIVRESKDADNVRAKNAFAILYERYYEELLRICISVCGSGPESEIVYERTWEKGFKHPSFGKNKERVAVITWLSRIARNTWYDIRQQVILGSDLPPEDACIPITDEYEVKSGPPTVEENLIKGALAELTEKDRDILLTYLDNDIGDGKHLPTSIIKELTTKYGVTSAALRQTKKRALEKIKMYIEKHR